MNNDAPVHIKDTINLFNTYRASKNIIKCGTDLITDKENVDYEYKKAEKIIKLVDNAILRMCFNSKDGNRYARTLFYRYLSDTIYSEKQIINILKHEQIAKSKPTYHRLRKQGLCAACAIIYKDEIDFDLIDEIKLPE